MPPKDTRPKAKSSDARLSAAQSRKLQSSHTDMATTLSMIANIGAFGAGAARKLARECLGRVNGEGAPE